MLATTICQLAVDCIFNDLQARSSDRLTAKPMSWSIQGKQSQIVASSAILALHLITRSHKINFGDPPLFSPGSVCQVGQDATYIPRNEPAHDKIRTGITVPTVSNTILPACQRIQLMFRFYQFSRIRFRKQNSLNLMVVGSSPTSVAIGDGSPQRPIVGGVDFSVQMVTPSISFNAGPQINELRDVADEYSPRIDPRSKMSPLNVRRVKHGGLSWLHWRSSRSAECSA
ncbi:hypothetical protein T08_15904 [Trichinella sp. T8]|nr:hypothetical protein T08_15904 [Trichinella sp. T8]